MGERNPLILVVKWKMSFATFESFPFTIVPQQINLGRLAMNYSIGEVANNAGLAISTLCYYDRKGMLPNMERSNGASAYFLMWRLMPYRLLND